MSTFILQQAIKEGSNNNTANPYTDNNNKLGPNNNNKNKKDLVWDIGTLQKYIILIKEVHIYYSIYVYYIMLCYIVYVAIIHY